MDAIESFKKRNIQKNARGGQVEEEQLEVQDFNDDEHLESMDHALEDFENMGNVINLQIGGSTNKDFFFRQMKTSDTGKPPMPSKNQQMSQ